MGKAIFATLLYFIGSLPLYGSPVHSCPVHTCPLKIVVSFSVLQDLVEEIGGEHVEVSAIVPPNADPHTYQPKPADAKSLSRADIIFMNGLGFEGWLGRLVAASGFKGALVVAGENIPARLSPANRETDPHAWHNVENAIRYAQTISRTLVDFDPLHKNYYEKRLAHYVNQLKNLHHEIHALFKGIPQENRKVVTTHDAFGYFGEAYQVSFFSPIGVNTEIQPSAQAIARLIDFIRLHAITAMFVENLASKQLLNQIAEETGVRVGGTLYADSLSEKAGPAPTYIEMMRYNATLIANALRHKNRVKLTSTRYKDVSRAFIDELPLPLWERSPQRGG